VKDLEGRKERSQEMGWVVISVESGWVGWMQDVFRRRMVMAF
jgi:hypothetical protein